MTNLSDSYLVETLYSGQCRVVTPEGEVYVSNGRPDANLVLRYLDRGMGPKGSAKWKYAGRAVQLDLDLLRQVQAAGRGCECCDGEGDHPRNQPCG